MTKKKYVPAPPQNQMCATCPWRKGSPYENLKSDLTERSFYEGRICHSTGNNAINARTGKPKRICRGSRNVQLEFFKAIGFISEATDVAWEEKCQELKASRHLK